MWTQNANRDAYCLQWNLLFVDCRSYSLRISELRSETTMPQITLTFKVDHPFVLTDGRRFKTLTCAAHSVLQSNNSHKLLPITNERTGCTYEIGDCMNEARKLDARSTW